MTSTYTTKLKFSGLQTNDHEPRNDAPPSCTVAVISTLPVSLVRRLSVQSTNIPLHAYAVPNSILSSDYFTVNTTLPSFTSDHQALTKLILEQTSLPPRPLVKTKGIHSEYGATCGADKVDFDLALNLPGLLSDTGGRIEVISADNRGLTGSEKTFKEHDDTSLREWVARFCKDACSSRRWVSHLDVILPTGPHLPFFHTLAFAFLLYILYSDSFREQKPHPHTSYHTLRPLMPRGRHPRHGCQDQISRCPLGIVPEHP